MSYAGGMGLFDHLKEAIVLDFSEDSHMREIFETLIEEYRKSGPACAAMMNALMNQCLIEVLRAAEEQSDGALPWLSALDDPPESSLPNSTITGRWSRTTTVADSPYTKGSSCLV